MKKYYDIAGKNFDYECWETLGETNTLKQAIQFIKKNVDLKSYTDEDGIVWIDINLLIDDDLIETYDMNGKKRG